MRALSFNLCAGYKDIERRGLQTVYNGMLRKYKKYIMA